MRASRPLPAALALLLALASVLGPAADPARAEPPDLLLADTYQRGIDLSAYWVSEKLDGIRARWDGERLISRGGNTFAAPDWFTAGFPEQALDGELWMGRGRFEETASVVTRNAPHAGWRTVHYRVFDLPDHPGPFDERLARLRQIIPAAASPYLDLIPQTRIATHRQLMQRLDAVVAAGGEGLMLHRGDALYRAGRSDDLLKLKPFDDAEARVIAHNPGKGRLQGMLGSLTVETPDRTRFRVGTGFTDAQRRQPPPIGSTITYRYQGLTRNGKPRFPVFWRVRADEPVGR